MRRAITLIALAAALVTTPASAREMLWYDGIHAVTLSVPKAADPVVTVAARMFASDMKAVTGQSAVTAAPAEATIRIVELDRTAPSERQKIAATGVPVDSLLSMTDAFHISVINRQIVVVGANGRGAAYGLLEMSRRAGVSPWIWWGDVAPQRRDRLTIDDAFRTTQGASVEFRGIFINDEDWSLRPWSYGTYEPARFGIIGPKTYKKVFQLLLRLRANTIWPAMHTGTQPFFLTPGAKAMADSCGIVVGTSHCEPLLRNNVGEWDVRKRGPFNYITNRKQVVDYWSERLRDVRGSRGGNLLTIGMRGIHDGSMEGVRTMDEKQRALQQVIDDQQQLIARWIGHPETTPQVFVPYKEVLEIYDRGLRVPDNVTLMWCDDNYGYMTRLSDSTEQKRRGGAGVYYHLSYWGRPHDYLWLTTTQPGLIYNEMREAYDHNARKLWIANVHDPKVAGYDLELFLDMAWNINSVSAATVADHYRRWLCRQFGSTAGEALWPSMCEFYRLCGERRPEFMGWSQTELDKRTYDRGLSPVRNTEFTAAFGDELGRYLDRFAAVAARVKAVAKTIPVERQDAFFAAIEYPVLAADANARKLLWAQKARQAANGSTTDGMFAANAAIYHACAESQSAYQEIRRLTEYYNDRMAGGKWRRSMNMRPRDLPVFGAPVLPTLLTDDEVTYWLHRDTIATGHHPLLLPRGVIARNAAQWTTADSGARVVSMLGHSMEAVALPKGGALTYDFTTADSADAVLRIALIPTQPNDNGDLRFSVSIDGAEPKIFSLKEKFRSEGWKQNVLRGQAVRTMALSGLKAGLHRLVIRAIDNHVVVDQWMIDRDATRKFYLFPVAGPSKGGGGKNTEK